MAVFDRTMVVPAGTLIGVTIQDVDGTPVGTVRDLAVDLFTGQVVYVLFDAVPAHSERAKCYVVPWQALQAADEGYYSLPINAELLKSAPAFDNSDLADQIWGKIVHEFYGLRPYWALRRHY